MVDILGNYTLNDHVRTDALADVYRATDTSLGRTVTVKVLRPAVAADPTRRDAVLSAAREAIPLSHPNVVELFEVGETSGRHFLAFEHVAGETLRATVAGTPLNVRKAVDFGAQLADALAEAHGRGLVHRGLRPETIMVTAKGRPKILDFGLAPAHSAVSSPDGNPQASPDDVECLSPEQVLGEHGDERTDVFALGCVLFEMLTGTSPFAAATGADTAVAILGRTPPPPSQMNARVPEALDRLVMNCLAKSLDRRAGSAAAIASQLRDIAAQMEIDENTGTHAVPQFAMPNAERRSRLGLVLLLLGVLAGVVWALLLFTR
ncbi:MAG: serine/threonine-protein kinase [Bacteroidales bacterium]